MAVLARLCDENARWAPLALGKLVCHILRLLEVGVALAYLRINAANDLADGLIAPEHLFHRHRDLPKCRTDPRSFHGALQQVALSRFRRLGKRLEGLVHDRLVARVLYLIQAADLTLAHGAIIDFPDVQRVFNFRPILVYSDNDFLA